MAIPYEDSRGEQLEGWLRDAQKATGRRPAWVIHRDQYGVGDGVTTKGRDSAQAAARLIIRTEPDGRMPIFIDAIPRVFGNGDGALNDVRFPTDVYINRPGTGWTHYDLIDLTVNGRRPQFLVTCVLYRDRSRNECIYADTREEAIVAGRLLLGGEGEKIEYGEVTITDLSKGYYEGWGTEPDEHHNRLGRGLTSNNVDYLTRTSLRDQIEHHAVNPAGTLTEVLPAAELEAG